MLSMLCGRPCLAADVIETVMLGPGGVDKELPLGRDFYLAGSADASVQEAYVVLVRTRWPFLGLGSTDVGECRKLRDSFGDEPRLGLPGLTTADKLWSKAEKLPALVPDRWSRGTSTDTSYKVLIPGSSFFRQGASYCLFSFVKKKVVNRAAVGFKSFLIEYGDALDKCSRSKCDEAAPTACDVQKPVLDCNDAAAALLVADIQKAFQADQDEQVDPAQVNAAWGVIRTKLGEAARKLKSLPDLINDAVGTWDETLKPQHGPDSTLYSADPPPVGDFVSLPAKDIRGFLLAGLLARKGELSWPEGKGFQVPDAQVIRIGLVADYSQFVVEVQPKDATAPMQRKYIPVAAGAVTLPDSTITLEDAWRLMSGYIKFDGQYLRIKDLRKTLLDDLLTHPGTGAVSAPRLEALTKLAAVTSAWAELLKKVKATLPSDTGNTALLLTQLKFGLFGYQDGAEVVYPLTRPDDPITQLNTLLLEYLDRARTWNGAPEVIKEKTSIKWEDVGTLTPTGRASLTQQRWFDTYFTPVVGRVHVFAETASYDEWYYGVQVFAFANPVNEPMWMNGKDDARRMLGLELAVIPKTGSFGPNDRFSGFAGNGTPGLMLGLVVQPLPYTTMSFGATWHTERESRVAIEESTARFAPYIALAVQANVPGLIRAMVAPATGTAVTDGAKP